MDLQELEKQYEEVKKSLQEVGERLKTLFVAVGEQGTKPIDDVQPVEEVKPTEEKPAAPQPVEQQQISAPQVEALMAKIDELAQTNSLILNYMESQKMELETLRQAQEEKIKALEEANDTKQERLEHVIQTAQEDRFRKDKGKLINRSIFQADLIRKTIYEYPEIVKEMNDEEKETFLLGQMKSIVTGIESMLTDEGVKIVHFAKVGEKINPEYQEVVGVKETTDEALNGTVAEVINPGYVWTLPYILKAKVNESGEEIKHYNFLLQTEQIIAYKYVQPQQ